MKKKFAVSEMEVRIDFAAGSCGGSAISCGAAA
jgi:hypothetical protein